MNFTADKNPPLTPERLAEFEGQLPHPLPADYRSFLLEHNGGVPERTFFKIPDCQGEALVGKFLGIDRPHDILFWMEEMKWDIPKEFLPIGFDPGGNGIFLDLSDGVIYYWDSRHHFPGSSPTENTYWVADSFTAFLDTLQEFHG